MKVRGLGITMKKTLIGGSTDDQHNPLRSGRSGGGNRKAPLARHSAGHERLSPLWPLWGACHKGNFGIDGLDFGQGFRIGSGQPAAQ